MSVPSSEIHYIHKYPYEVIIIINVATCQYEFSLHKIIEWLTLAMIMKMITFGPKFDEWVKNKQNKPVKQEKVDFTEETRY